MMRAAKTESEGRHQLKITDESLTGSEDTAHHVFLDIEDFISCNLRFKKCFIGHCSIVLAVMRRYSSSVRIQASGCRIIDGLGCNEVLRLELVAAGAVDVLMLLLRSPLMQLSQPEQTTSESDEEKSKRKNMAYLFQYACGAVTSLLLDCPSSAKSFHDMGIAGCIVDIFNAHFYPVICRRQHQESAQIVAFHALNVVSMLADDDKARDLLAELGICAMVEEAAREYEDDEATLTPVGACFAVHCSLVQSTLTISTSIVVFTIFCRS
jgi:hypothetical protein